MQAGDGEGGLATPGSRQGGNAGDAGARGATSTDTSDGEDSGLADLAANVAGGSSSGVRLRLPPCLLHLLRMTAAGGPAACEPPPQGPCFRCKSRRLCPPDGAVMCTAGTGHTHQGTPAAVSGSGTAGV